MDRLLGYDSDGQRGVGDRRCALTAEPWVSHAILVHFGFQIFHEAIPTSLLPSFAVKRNSCFMYIITFNPQIAV